jgi:hypothetical protein
MQPAVSQHVSATSGMPRRLLGALAAVLAAATLVLLPGAGSASAADQTQMEIVNVASGLRADVMWASTAEHAGVFLWPNNSSLSQEFNLLDSGNGFLRIQARHSGQCLMLDWNVGNTNGTPIIQNPYCGTGYSPNEWQVRATPCLPTGPGTFCVQRHLLVNHFSGRCLDARNPTTSPPPQQAVLQQWDCISSGTEWNFRNQDWSVQSIFSPVVR